MIWDYRIIKQADGLMEIRQIFYKEDGTIYGMSEDKISIEGFELDEITMELESLLKALEKPIIELSIHNKIKKNPEDNEKEHPVDALKIKYYPDDLKNLFIRD